MKYSVYLADDFTLGEINYLVSEWEAQVVCKNGHCYLFVPYQYTLQ